MAPGDDFRTLSELFLKDRRVSLKQRKGSEGTLAVYRYSLTRLCEWAAEAEVTPAAFTRQHVNDYMAWLIDVGRKPGYTQKTTAGAELAASTLHSYRGILRSLLLFAEDAGYIEKAPKFPKQARPKPSPSFLTDDQLAAVLAACTNARDRAIVAVLADSGLRRAEVCALNWADVEYKDGLGRIYVRHGKGAKARSSYFTPAAWALLSKYAKSRPQESDSPVFLGVSDDHRLNEDGLARMLARLGARVGLRLHPHMLRHTAARRMLARGMPWPSVQRALGHSTAAITLDLYGSFSEAMTEGAYRQAFENSGRNGRA
jgi:integrase